MTAGSGILGLALAGQMTAGLATVGRKQAGLLPPALTETVLTTAGCQQLYWRQLSFPMLNGRFGAMYKGPRLLELPIGGSRVYKLKMNFPGHHPTPPPPDPPLLQ